MYLQPPSQCGESAGTAIVFGLPSLHALPSSPLALNTDMPDAAAVAKNRVDAVTSATVVWSSQ